jgi:CRISPR-associated protein Csm3
MGLRLIKIQKLEACLQLQSGLRIGASEGEIRIGGVDNQVIRHPHTDHPYIPGSSLKGKVRSLLEWLSGAVKPDPLSYADIDKAPLAKPILQLFGVSGGDKLTKEQALQLGPSRLAFWDAALSKSWAEKVKSENQLLVEVKTENRIDRIQGVARDPRSTERVPAGAEFDFVVSIKVLSEDAGDGEALRNVLFCGLRLLELDSLGGSGSRGYGKVKFRNLRLDGDDIQPKFQAIDPFAIAA